MNESTVLRYLLRRALFACMIGVYFAIIGWSIRSRRQPAVRWVTVTVESGDTLWQLCDRVNDDSVDLRRCVSLARSKCPGTIHQGQVVNVPVLDSGKGDVR